MNIFSVFHTNEYDSAPLLIREDNVVSVGEFKSVVKTHGAYLKNLDTKNIAIISENAFDFAVWFFACVYSYKDIFLVSDVKKSGDLLLDYEIVDAVLPEKDSDFELVQPDFDSVFVHLFTSGSTGKPKHVKKTFSIILDEAAAVFEAHSSVYFGKKDLVRIISSVSAQHMYGLCYYFLLPMCHFDRMIMDASTVVYPSQVNVNNCVFVSSPSFMETFQKYDEKPANPPLCVFSAGAKLKQSVYEYFEKFCQVIEVFGCTECGTIGYKNSSLEEGFFCYKGVCVSVDSNNCLVVESPYFLENRLVSGDIVKFDKNNCFIPCRRNDRILKIQEKRISAPEIEQELLKNDYISDAYCFKFDDKLACAAVLSASGADFALENNISKHLKAFILEKFDIVPQKWKFLYCIPKNCAGKTDADKITEIFSTNLSFPVVLNYRLSEQTADFEMVFLKSSNFFNGHFNNLPILPGVVQLNFAGYFIQEAFGIKINTEIVKKIKFSKVIKPQERVTLSLAKNGKNISYTFKKGDNVCSSGIMEEKL